MEGDTGEKITYVHKRGPPSGLRDGVIGGILWRDRVIRHIFWRDQHFGVMRDRAKI